MLRGNFSKVVRDIADSFGNIVALVVAVRDIHTFAGCLAN